MRAAVVGHVEWTRLARVGRVPGPGEIVHASIVWEGPAGGGAVAAVQLARLAGSTTFFTALGDDALGRRAAAMLENLGVEVRAAVRSAPTRETVGLIDDSGERTLTTLGERLNPLAADPLGWADLAGVDAVYFTAGDAAALRHARLAGVLVATARELETIARCPTCRLDALVGSRRDQAETYRPGRLAEPPELVVLTDGAGGGVYSVRGGAPVSYTAVEPPGPVIDTYGTGDCFAGTLTYGLGARMSVENALGLAAQCAAVTLTGRGPYAPPGRGPYAPPGSPGI